MKIEPSVVVVIGITVQNRVFDLSGLSTPTGIFIGPQKTEKVQFDKDHFKLLEIV